VGLTCQVHVKIRVKTREEVCTYLIRSGRKDIYFFRERDTSKVVLMSNSYQGKQLAVQGKDSLTHNDAKKIKLH
jgi:hypothetical protein